MKEEEKPKGLALKIAKKIVEGNFNMEDMNDRFEDEYFLKKVSNIVSFIRTH